MEEQEKSVNQRVWAEISPEEWKNLSQREQILRMKSARLSLIQESTQQEPKTKKD